MTNEINVHSSDDTASRDDNTRDANMMDNITKKYLETAIKLTSGPGHMIMVIKLLTIIT